MRDDRFWAKVEKIPFTTCWIWTGAQTITGYGHVMRRANGETHCQMAHRRAYELLVGKIPTGLELDHLCQNRGCVNPAHLEPVTRRENNLRSDNWGGRNSRKVACKAGHPFTPENTYVRRGRYRQCRTCKRMGAREYEQRRKVRARRETPFSEATA